MNTTKTKHVKKEVNRIEDIFPLTIVSMRYGGRFIIFNAHHDKNFIDPVYDNEEVSRDIFNWLETNVKCDFGIGDTIAEAFEDYKVRD